MAANMNRAGGPISDKIFTSPIPLSRILRTIRLACVVGKTHRSIVLRTLNGKTKRKIMAGGQEKRSSMWVSMVDTRFFPRRFRRLKGLLLPIGLPALLDQIGVYVFDVLGA
jgi:hypothetical protein